VDSFYAVHAIELTGKMMLRFFRCATVSVFDVKTKRRPVGFLSRAAVVDHKAAPLQSKSDAEELSDWYFSLYL